MRKNIFYQKEYNWKHVLYTVVIIQSISTFLTILVSKDLGPFLNTILLKPPIYAAMLLITINFFPISISHGNQANSFLWLLHFTYCILFGIINQDLLRQHGIYEAVFKLQAMIIATCIFTVLIITNIFNNYNKTIIRNIVNDSKFTILFVFMSWLTRYSIFQNITYIIGIIKISYIVIAIKTHIKNIREKKELDNLIVNSCFSINVVFLACLKSYS